uniref:Transmembrane protein n=1 Tax=Panagrolaimus sp. JU765 TaxID=591449 RepID=A0AC34R697_9BILA
MEADESIQKNPLNDALVDELENTSDYSENIQNGNGSTKSSNKTPNKISKKKISDPNNVKVFIIGFFMFFFILFLFFTTDMLLTVKSNVDYNKDRKIISTYCFRRVLSRARKAKNDLQIDTNQFIRQQLRLFKAHHEKQISFEQLKNQQFDLFYKSVESMTATEDLIKRIGEFQEYRQRKISYETNEIKCFYIIIAIMSVMAIDIVCMSFGKKDMFFKILTISLCFAIFLSILFYCSHLFQEFDDPAKTAECPFHIFSLES